MQRARDCSGCGIGVDVVGLRSVGGRRQRRDHRHESGCEQGADQTAVDRGDGSNRSQRHSIAGLSGLGEKQPPVFPAYTGRLDSQGPAKPDEPLVDGTAERGFGDPQRRFRGHAQPRDALGFNALARKRGIDFRSAPVDQHHTAAAGEHRADVLQNGGGSLAFHRVAAELYEKRGCKIMHNVHKYTTMYALAPAPGLIGRHFLEIADISAADLRSLLALATYLKNCRQSEQLMLLRGKTLGMLFEKPSLRTRVSFEVGMAQLGGQVIFAQGSEFMVGSRETPEDAARVLSRYVDVIVIRTHAHEPLVRFARASSVPVINGLSAAAHPCQALADLLTMQERFGSLAGLHVAYLGDAANNVASSLAQAAVLAGATVHFGTPGTHRPSEAFLAQLQALGKPHGGTARAFASATRAVRGADVVYTDVWTSMGEEHLQERNAASLAPFRVTQELLAYAEPHAIFMHCLPAHRGEEVTDDVMEGAQSAVFDQAENRLHAQKALLLSLLTELRGMPV